MAKIEITWSRLIPFNESEIKKLEESGGVYRLSKKKEDGKFYVFFVGSASNLKEQIMHHLSNKEDDLQLKLYLTHGGEFSFRYALVADEAIRKAIEKQLYKHYLPELNSVEPQSSLDIEANIN